MCQNAQGTAVSLLTAIEPTIKNLLTVTGVINTDEGNQIITYYDAALAAVKNWQNGTPAQNAIQAINDLQEALPLLPIPALYQALLSVILAGITTVLGVLSANSPAPLSTDPADGIPTAEPHEIQAAHQAKIAVDTTAEVEKLVPGFKRSIFHSPASQYQKAWDSAVDQASIPTDQKGTLKAA